LPSKVNTTEDKIKPQVALDVDLEKVAREHENELKMLKAETLKQNSKPEEKPNSVSESLPTSKPPEI
jgi:hypothetical protein